MDHATGLTMGLQQRMPFFLVLLLLACLKPHSVVARPLPLLKQKEYVKVLESLGMFCQCCDGAEGKCRDTWDATCSKLDCHPWKLS